MPRENIPGGLRRVGKTYRWRWQLDGDRVHRTFYTTDRAEAVREVKKAVAEIEAKAARRRAGTADVTMRDLLDDFTASYLPQLSEGGQSAYRDSLGLFRQYFVEERGNPLVIDVRPPDVSKFIDWRRALRRKGKRKEAPTKPPAQATLRRDHRVLHTIFQWAVENRELRPDNPCTRKTKPKKGRRAPTSHPHGRPDREVAQGM